ncbi:hypothetical protein HUU62_17070 [Rhodoferax sp. 4810]|nr:hypothetical protein [Rhodoferax jenense]
MNETQSESLPKPVESAQPTGIARRRLLRVGLAAGPVVLTMSGRSAMATGCAKGLSPLAWNSLAPSGTNCQLASHTVRSNTLGVSPGNWKPNGNGSLTRAWPASCLPYTTYTAPTSWDSSKWATGTKFNALFTVIGGFPTTYVDGIDIRTKSVSRILIDNNGTIEWHLCAAYLNAATVADYAMTIPEVMDAYAGKIGVKNISSEDDMKAFLTQTWV